MKGIKFFGVLAAASLLFSVSAFAQEDANRDENGKVVRGAYETNRAFVKRFRDVDRIKRSSRQVVFPCKGGLASANRPGILL